MDFDDLQDISDAPVDVIRLCCGDELADTVFAELQGQQVYIPMPDHITTECRLVGLFGFENAKSISKYLGGGSVEFPMLRENAASQRRQLIKMLYLAGTGQNLIAKLASCSRRNVSRVIKSLKQTGEIAANVKPETTNRKSKKGNSNHETF